MRFTSRPILVLLFFGLFSFAPSSHGGICRNVAAAVYYWWIGADGALAKLKVNRNIKVGKGDFGSVYVGYSPEQVKLSNEKTIKGGDRVAVKVASPEEFSKEAIRNEIKMANKLASQSIHFLGLKRFGGILVSEYYPNSMNLRDFMRPDNLKVLGSRYNKALIEEFSRQLDAALDVLQKNKIVHGDIATSNILVVQENGAFVLKLIDFGSAAFVGEYPFYEGGVGVRMYHFPFASPGEREDEPASYTDDRYSVNKVLERMNGVLSRHQP